MELVRQSDQDGLCVGCCLAMITGESINQVLAFCHLCIDPKSPRPYVPIREAIRYLFERGLCYGGPLTFDEPLAVAEGITDLDSKTALTRSPHPAMLTVRSRKIEGGLHMVVWDPDQRCILDPGEDAPQPLSAYRIIDWAQIIPISEI